MTNPVPGRDIAVLIEIMRRLRAECPWDRAQTFATIAPYTIEEAYEVASAIEDGDLVLKLISPLRPGLIGRMDPASVAAMTSRTPSSISHCNEGSI